MKPAEKAKALGIQLWTPVYIRGKGVAMKQTDDGSYVEVGEIGHLLASRQPVEGEASLPPQGSKAEGLTPFGCFVSSLRWAVAWIDEHGDFTQEMPSGDASDWLEWAGAKDLLKDADAALDSPQPQQQAEEVVFCSHCGRTDDRAHNADCVFAQEERQQEGCERCEGTGCSFRQGDGCEVEETCPDCNGTGKKQPDQQHGEVEEGAS